jgi:hypothetical protein
MCPRVNDYRVQWRWDQSPITFAYFVDNDSTSCTCHDNRCPFSNNHIPTRSDDN